MDNLNERLNAFIVLGDLEHVKYLVEHGADIRAHNDMALLSPSSAGHIEIVKYLTEQG